MKSEIWKLRLIYGHIFKKDLLNTIYCNFVAVYTAYIVLSRNKLDIASDYYPQMTKNEKSR